MTLDEIYSNMTDDDIIRRAANVTLEDSVEIKGLKKEIKKRIWLEENSIIVEFLNGKLKKSDYLSAEKKENNKQLSNKEILYLMKKNFLIENKEEYIKLLEEKRVRKLNDYYFYEYIMNSILELFGIKHEVYGKNLNLYFFSSNKMLGCILIVLLMLIISKFFIFILLFFTLILFCKTKIYYFKGKIIISQLLSTNIININNIELKDYNSEYYISYLGKNIRVNYIIIKKIENIKKNIEKNTKDNEIKVFNENVYYNFTIYIFLLSIITFLIKKI